jgi:branched-chain amino acid transport system permease protein
MNLPGTRPPQAAASAHLRTSWPAGIALVLALAAPWVIYPTFLMKVLCFALFACAFNLLLGYAGLLSFGHAAFFGGSAYVCAGLQSTTG